MLRKIQFCLLAGLLSSPVFAQQKAVDYVNPIIGTNGMGHTFPGACVPFGLIQLSPDTDTIPHNYKCRDPNREQYARQRKGKYIYEYRHEE